MGKTATGISITAEVRKKQLQFHALQAQFDEIEKRIGPAQEEYNELRKTYSGSHGELKKLRDVLVSAKHEMAKIRRVQRMLCGWIELTHVMKQGNENFRPGIATTGHPD